MNYLEPPTINWLAFKRLDKAKLNETRVIKDSANEPLFVSIPYKEYLILIDKAKECEILTIGYHEIVTELFPTNVDQFKRELNHTRIMNEIKTLRVVHSANVKLNMLLGDLKDKFSHISIKLNLIMNSFKEF